MPEKSYGEAGKVPWGLHIDNPKGIHRGLIASRAHSRQESLQARLIDGWGIKIALHEFATKLLEISLLAGHFNAFGNHFEMQMMSERHDQTCDFAAFTIVLDVTDKRAIYLQDIDRKTAQAA